MLFKKQLHPWLLIHLISNIVILVFTIAVLVVIFVVHTDSLCVNTPLNLTSCAISTNYKMTFFMQLILRLCFIFSILAIAFALAQVIFILWQFFKFKMLMSKHDNSQNAMFGELTFKKLIVLYLLNFFCIMSIIPVFGSHLMFFV